MQLDCNSLQKNTFTNFSICERSEKTSFAHGEDLAPRASIGPQFPLGQGLHDPQADQEPWGVEDKFVFSQRTWYTHVVQLYLYCMWGGGGGSLL